MRLKCIKLAGFKSFVDPTTVNFPSNLCAVVGPNGCGKSNIIDAVRWVMGESSAKNLRGESMTDVIFNGSGGRKPVGQASIELVFDNSDGTVVGEFAGYSEISIKRKVTRESQTFYYLNGNKCRRRDITDIFLGTGLGPRSYAIIEQGMISRLIEAKPEELRVYIEEAAGISKYKERRRDTENRMRRTFENLERLTDIREELERQISRLERQAQAAEKYTEFKKEERELKAQLQALRYQLLQAKSDEKHLAITKLELRVESEVTDQVHHDSEIEKHRTLFTEMGDVFNEVQGRYYSVGSDITRIEQGIQHAEERERQLKIDLEQTERDCAEAEEHLAIDQGKAEGWEAELLEIQPDLEMVKDAEEESGSVLLEAEDGMHHWQQDWDQFNQRAAEPRQQAEVQQSRIKYLEQVQSRLLERITKLEAERDGLVIGDVKDEIAELDEEVASLELSAEEKSIAVESLTESVNQLREKQHQINEERDQLRSELQSSRGRFASLEALQQAALGQGGKMGDWLESQGLHNFPRLAEMLTVDQGWEKAVEAVLGKSLQAVCADQTLEQLSNAIGQLDAGEVTLFAKADTAHKSAVTTTLLSKVQSPIDLSSQLQGVLVVDDLSTALQSRSSLDAGQSLVTRDGIWLGRNWLKLVKDDDANAGVIARKQELELLQEKIETLEERVELLSESFENTKMELSDAETERENKRREAGELSRKHSEKRSELSSRKAKVEQVLEGRQRAERDIADARTQMSAESENLVNARTLLQDAITAMETDTDEREKLLSRRDEMRSRLDGARQKARHDKDRAHELAMRSQSLKTQLDAIKQGIQRLQDQMSRMQERRENLRASLEDNREPIEENKMELEALLEKRITVEKQLSEARRSVETVETALREAEKQRHQVESSIGTLRASLESARLDAQAIDTRREGLKQQLAEQDLNIDILLAELDPTLEESVLEEGLEKVGNRISRLGAINLAAIDEYKTESERKNYLDAQDKDLRDALETLENAIKKIDRETRTRFKETFDQINTGLLGVVSKSVWRWSCVFGAYR